ncbi:hypothetical protein MARCHEWKA_04890 [Brevundimonas phage vB_BpoS-Marchewka]|uniref:Uncharacterized protein n=1 Tax=Brevundimonas phage vB_BpoS-Marchewka TaxID=2948604 RepID=A0A9E7SSN1_9CAUD|nr:hypothetical protein MARCHEWKA_04890 [Brevundimonas phage vB_BpoS-Marchewka]UTC29444.1 hypothetical protein BAMBUS_03620 [Brevundimonas phage vB_BpoS-Bambus]
MTGETPAHLGGGRFLRDVSHSAILTEIPANVKNYGRVRGFGGVYALTVGVRKAYAVITVIAYRSSRLALRL